VESKLRWGIYIYTLYVQIDFKLMVQVKPLTPVLIFIIFIIEKNMKNNKYQTVKTFPDTSGMKIR